MRWLSSKRKDFDSVWAVTCWERAGLSGEQDREDWVRDPKNSGHSGLPFSQLEILAPKVDLRAVVFKVRPPFPKYGCCACSHTSTHTASPKPPIPSPFQGGLPHTPPRTHQPITNIQDDLINLAFFD